MSPVQTGPKSHQLVQTQPPVAFSEDAPVTTRNSQCADIVGFGHDGVTIGRFKENTMYTSKVSEYFTPKLGWGVEVHIRLLANTTHPRRADIVGFADDGVWVCENLGNNTFAPAKRVSSDLSLHKGGYADIIGFGHSSVFVCLNVDKGSYKPEVLAVADFGYDQGWRVERHLRILADMTGDGFPDIVGFGETDVIVGLNNGDGSFQKGEPVVDSFCYSSGGWRVKEHPRFLADLTGSGRMDIIGFKGDRVFTCLNQGNLRFGPVVEQNIQIPYPCHLWIVTPLQVGKPADIVGFCDDGVYAAINEGNGNFQPAKRIVTGFGTSSSWQVDKHPRFVADLNRSGFADIIGFGDAGVFAAFNQGDGTFSAMTMITSEFSYNKGWKPNETVRYMANLYQYNT
ncbi:Psathyrella Velutina lectin At 1.5a resolution [Coprinopsis marcescibilis]|uniref:Psathyrella Velutina lectin At 1.5a resolution n=1 Tax=Coprinopsis marcescibilis TaxID=230819 RepID=A0A5C3KYT6_COPMA|nr:Psathyrella Velutina lectin At 1.5a resolution [Coprinopsis marcescibilis]